MLCGDLVCAIRNGSILKEGTGYGYTVGTLLYCRAIYYALIHVFYVQFLANNNI